MTDPTSLQRMGGGHGHPAALRHVGKLEAAVQSSLASEARLLGSGGPKEAGPGSRSAPTEGAGHLHTSFWTQTLAAHGGRVLGGTGSPRPPTVPSTLLGALAIAARSRPAAARGWPATLGADPRLFGEALAPWRGDHSGRGWGLGCSADNISARSGALLIGFLYEQMDCESSGLSTKRRHKSREKRRLREVTGTQPP